ncbi:MAG: hypothetical protein JW787_15970 [Sedimentisphaerales bacterium]|nr:hypothetical protein [Sedimentisphaerales bacterium]
MNEIDKDSVRRWIAGWQAAAPLLEKLRNDEIRRSDTTLAIEQLSDAFESVLRNHSPNESSGLVEQQRLFARCRV